MVVQCTHMKLTSRWVDLTISSLLFVFALLLYLYRISEITPGMWGDEVSLGWMAQELSQLRTFTPFLAHNLGHPTPLIYLASLLISLFGKSIVSLRLTSVLFGSLSAVSFYFFLRLFFNRSLSFFGTILLITSYVLLVVTRFAYEMSAAIFFFICAAWALVQFSRHKSPKWAILFSLLIGAGIYTYLAFRAVAIVLLISGLAIILKEKTKKTFSFRCNFYSACHHFVPPYHLCPLPPKRV